MNIIDLNHEIVSLILIALVYILMIIVYTNIAKNYIKLSEYKITKIDKYQLDNLSYIDCDFSDVVMIEDKDLNEN